MASDKKVYFKVSNLLALSPGDLDGDSVTPQFRPGGLNFMSDAYGPRILKYIRLIQTAAVDKGRLLSAASAGTDQRHTAFTVASGGGSTLHAAITGATAGRHDGMIVYVAAKAGGGGGAPEGEATICRNNTATRINFEADYPLSTALGASDVLHVIATYQTEDAVADDQTWVTEGFVIAEQGLTGGNYGWVQQYGAVMAKATAAAITLGHEVVAAGTGQVRAKGAQTAEDWVGVALAGYQAVNQSLRLPVKATIFVSRSGIAP